MAKLSVREFVKKVTEDAAFRTQLGLSDEMDGTDFHAKAVAAGYDYPIGELLAEANALSDADLDAVSGGGGSGPIAPTPVQPTTAGGAQMIRFNPGATMSRKF
jgi:predicted ribosomally synthesized peptide with nif11-like leader